MEIRLHKIEDDGLPEMDTLVGRVAFIFDGCIVSGPPLDPVEHADIYNRYGWSDTEDGILWEANSDVGHTRPFGNVAYWVEFPEPLWSLTSR